MNRSERLAVLIDAENISHVQADRIFELVATLGTPTVRRIYCNIKGSAGSWESAARGHALEVRHCIAPAKGKNGADIALTVGAMDLLRDGAVDGFCIVSSDSDFAELVRRIREEGRLAFGIGRSVTTAGYRGACTEFLVLDQPAAAPAPRLVTPSPQEALPSIHLALKSCKIDPNGWYNLADFGTAAPGAGVAPKLYGLAKMGELLDATRHFTRDGQRFRPTPMLTVVPGSQ